MPASRPLQASGGKLTYKSSKPDVVSVDQYGRWTALASGCAVITVKVDGRARVSARVSIYVRPAAPEKITVQKETQGTRLSWEKTPGAKKYEIWRSTKKKNGWKRVARQKSTSFLLKGEKKYFYRVRACKKEGKVWNYSRFSAAVRL